LQRASDQRYVDVNMVLQSCSPMTHNSKGRNRKNLLSHRFQQAGDGRYFDAIGELERHPAAD